MPKVIIIVGCAICGLPMIKLGLNGYYCKGCDYAPSMQDTSIISYQCSECNCKLELFNNSNNDQWQCPECKVVYDF